MRWQTKEWCYGGCTQWDFHSWSTATTRTARLILSTSCMTITVYQNVLYKTLPNDSPLRLLTTFPVLEMGCSCIHLCLLWVRDYIHTKFLPDQRLLIVKLPLLTTSNQDGASDSQRSRRCQNHNVTYRAQQPQVDTLYEQCFLD